MEKLSNESALGFLGILTWCIISAVAFVFTTLLELRIDATLLCFGIFFIALIFFGLSRLNSLLSLGLKCKAHLLKVSMINITTFGCWFLTIYPLQFINPSIAQAILAAVTPISTLLLGIVLYKNQRVGYKDYMMSILLFMGMFFLIAMCFDQNILSHHFTFFNLTIALLCCIGAGIFLAINNIYAKKLSVGGFLPLDILAIRFFLLAITTGLLSYHSIHLLFHPDILFNVGIVALTLIIVPQIIFQYALKELEPITISVISPLMPIMIFIPELFTNKLNPTVWTIIGVTYISLISIASAKIRYTNQRKPFHTISNLAKNTS